MVSGPKSEVVWAERRQGPDSYLEAELEVTLTSILRREVA